jgi:hypothetical protein
MYIYLIIYITIIFSAASRLSPAPKEDLLTSPAIERFIPNELNSQTKNQKFVLSIRGGEGTSIPELIIKILFIWSITQNSKTTQGFKPNQMNQHFSREIQPQPNPRIAPKLRVKPLDINNPSQGSCNYKSNNIVKTGVMKDGSIIHVNSSKIRDKAHHMGDFLSPEDLEGKFDLDCVKSIRSHQERLKYVRNKNNLPDDLVYKMQDEVLKFVTDDGAMIIPGFIGEHKEEGTVLINLKLEKVAFRDYGTNNFRTAVSMKTNKIKKLVKEGFHLFQNSDNK